MSDSCGLSDNQHGWWPHHCTRSFFSAFIGLNQSKCFPLRSVPQGSVLGPLCFLPRSTTDCKANHLQLKEPPFFSHLCVLAPSRWSGGSSPCCSGSTSPMERGQTINESNRNRFLDRGNQLKCQRLLLSGRMFMPCTPNNRTRTDTKWAP